jgi:hypothetical protein
MTPLTTCAVLFFIGTTTAAAQTASQAHWIVFADVGYARTLDDEGYLGSGAAVSAGVGFRVSPRWTIQATVDRIPYFRDIEYLRFDGRVLFAGVEAAFLSTNVTVRPYFTVGAGLMHDHRIWINKTTIDLRLPRVEERHDLLYQLRMFRSSTGLDFRISERTSIRAGVRLHGLLDTGGGRDLAPHTIIQTTIGAAFRW